MAVSLPPLIASYLPKPGCQEYEFVYVDAKGGVSCRSSKFTFCFPKPLEELVTLEEEQQEGEEGATGMLLVVPRAELLQVSGTSMPETLWCNAVLIAAAAAVVSLLFCHRVACRNACESGPSSCSCRKPPPGRRRKKDQSSEELGRPMTEATES